MLSTFDLTLLGSLVVAGGLVLLRQGKWLDTDFRGLSSSKRRLVLTAEHEDLKQRSTALAGTRWLTVGALTLFIAFAHGEKEGYLFGPWTDVLFHVVFVSSCWAMTVYRINQIPERDSVS